MKKAHIQIYLPKKPGIAERLDLMMELGEIPTLEVREDALLVLDEWKNRDRLRTLLHDAFPDVKMVEEILEDKDWNLEWIEGFQPIHIAGKIWVTPPWHLSRIPEDDIRIIINPGNAFGTGTHESTRLALELMTKLITEGDTVWDLGCGSGILSIAAIKMGASRVYAVDNDPEIHGNMGDNIQLNNAGGINAETADVLLMNDFNCDLAVINIQKHIILPLLARFNIAKHTPKHVILAGLLNEHRKEIESALMEQAYDVIEVLRQNNWIAVAAVKRSLNE
jgi:ribosomal protein L11 methyltransferase